MSPEELDASLNVFLSEYTLDEECRNPEYSLIDINRDKIPELFVRYENMVGSSAKMYVYKDSKFICTNIDLNDAMISQTENLIKNTSYEGAAIYSFYKLNEFRQLEWIEELKSYAEQHYQFDKLITENEFNERLSYYNNNLTWIVAEFTEFEASNSTSNENPTTDFGNNNDYTTYDTSAAGNDFSFNNEPYQRKVRTESDSLNLRAAPSTSAEIITQMPKDSIISLWGVNSE